MKSWIDIQTAIGDCFTLALYGGGAGGGGGVGLNYFHIFTIRKKKEVKPFSYYYQSNHPQNHDFMKYDLYF